MKVGKNYTVINIKVLGPSCHTEIVIRWVLISVLYRFEVVYELFEHPDMSLFQS